MKSRGGFRTALCFWGGSVVNLGKIKSVRLFQTGLEEGLGEEDFAAVRKVLAGMNER